MTSQKARILLVDDHTLILQGIKHVVSQMPEIEKVYTASSGAEAMLLIDMQPFDIYLLDVELPDTNGFELIDKILQIQTILKGGQYLCKRFKTILNRMQTEEQIKEQLTLREMEVLQAIAKGFNTREIADLLHVSNNTIETHRKSLMSKLEARNAVDLVLKAINLGIIPLDSK